MSAPADEHDQLTIAFGPLGTVGLALLAWAALRRRRLVGLAAAAAVGADATVPALGGLAAARSRARSHTAV